MFHVEHLNVVHSIMFNPLHFYLRSFDGILKIAIKNGNVPRGTLPAI